jgi:hypothetical protein
VAAVTSNSRNRALAVLGTLYAVASLIHFAHNAEYVTAYPNLPAWLTRYEVYGAWLGITAIGALGYTLHHRGNTLLGLLLIGVYAAIGLDGLLHYGRAPFEDHTWAMNATILFEVSVAACLLLTVVTLIVPHLKQGELHD